MRIAITPKWFWRFCISRHILARELRDLVSRTQGDDCMDRTGFTHVTLLEGTNDICREGQERTLHRNGLTVKPSRGRRAP
jgi:hypothetical protein